MLDFEYLVHDVLIKNNINISLTIYRNVAYIWFFSRSQFPLKSCAHFKKSMKELFCNMFTDTDIII